jgi:hypothetical protein
VAGGSGDAPHRRHPKAQESGRKTRVAASRPPENRAVRSPVLGRSTSSWPGRAAEHEQGGQKTPPLRLLFVAVSRAGHQLSRSEGVVERARPAGPDDRQERPGCDGFDLTRQQENRADELAWSFDEVSVERCNGERARLCGYNYGAAGDRTLAHEEYVAPDGRRRHI